MKVAWPSGLRRWFKAPVSSEAWVRIPPLPTAVLFCAPAVISQIEIKAKMPLSEVGFEPTPSYEDQNTPYTSVRGKIALESGALDHSATLTAHYI